MNTIDTLIANLLGAAPVNYITDVNGVVTTVYDTYFILKAIILIIIIKAIMELVLVIPRQIARRIHDA